MGLRGVCVCVCVCYVRVGVFVHLEFRCCYVEADGALILVAGLLDGLHDKLGASTLVAWRGEAALIPDKSRVATVLGLDDLGQVVVHLGPNQPCVCVRAHAR